MSVVLLSHPSRPILWCGCTIVNEHCTFVNVGMFKALQDRESHLSGLSYFTGSKVTGLPVSDTALGGLEKKEAQREMYR